MGFWRRRLADLAGLVIRLLTGTVRLRTVNRAARDRLEAAGTRPLYAFWHGRQLPLFAWDVPPGTAVLVSNSRDGDLQARILRGLGFRVARGSGGGQGASGLKALARLVRAGAGAAFTVDGGRGPCHTVHAGVLLLARLTGRPVIPVGVGVRRRHVFVRSWDRYLLPAPFTRGVVVLGEPLVVPRRARRDDLPALAAELGRRIHAATAEADAACAAPPEPAATGVKPCPVCAAALASDEAPRLEAGGPGG